MSKLLINIKQRNRHHQRGVVLPLFAVGMLAIIGIVGVSIDIGHVFLNKTRLQNSLDSAALSGARTLMLLNDIDAASADARAVFSEHLDGEMGNLDAGNLILQYSDKLVPFVAGGSSPRFVRAVIQDFTTNLTLSSILPNVSESLSIAGSAIAGPIPVGHATGGTTCDITPLLMCKDPNLNECWDELCSFILHSGAGIESSGDSAVANSVAQLAVCGDGSAGDSCGSEVKREDKIFLPGYLGCTDNDECIRENFAGSFDSCLTHDATVSSEQVGVERNIFQGLKTRLGEYHSSLDSAKYPPDVVQNTYSQYENYKNDVISFVANGFNDDDGVAYRRVVVVPEVDCEELLSSQNAVPIQRIHCLFLAEVDDKDIEQPFFKGQLINECEASGDQGETIPALSTSYAGPMEIILYNDPNNDES